MSADTIEAAETRPRSFLSSPLFTLAVAALVPLFRFLSILRDYLARKETPECCLNFIPPLLLVAAGWGAWTPVIFRLGRRFPPSRAGNVLVHLGAVIVLALPIELAWWFFASPEKHWPPPDPFGTYVLIKLANSIVPYALILGASVLRDRYVERARHARLMLRLERQLADTELAALRTQLDPAFLHSSLEEIENACRRDHQRAERLVVSLADFLRSTLEQIQQREATPTPEPETPPAPPFTLGWPVAAALLVVASLLARAVTETGTNESLLDFVRWAGVGTLLTVPGCFLSVWAAHRMARSWRPGAVMLVVFVGTFAAAYVSELAYALVRPGGTS